jgi:acetylglutamate synthase
MDLCERLVFGIILYKKNRCDMKIRITQEQFDAVFDNVTSRKCTKRPEEKLKFIFKRSLKHLLKKFSEEHSKKEKFSSNKNLLKRFNEHYYTDVAKKMNLSLSEFFPPNRSKNDNGSFNKTLNLQYLAKLAKNPKILSSMVEYINHFFLKDYLIELKTSLRSLIIKITEMINTQYHKINTTTFKQKPTTVFQQNEINSLTNLISNNFNSDQVEKELKTLNKQEGVVQAVRLFGEMKETILKQKMRIPWTVKEVQSGIMFVKKKLERIQKKNEN